MVTLSEACDDPKKVEFSVENLKPSEGGGRKWAEYVKGVVANFHGPLKGCGFDAVIATSVPIGKFLVLDFEFILENILLQAGVSPVQLPWKLPCIPSWRS